MSAEVENLWVWWCPECGVGQEDCVDAEDAYARAHAHDAEHHVIELNA
jgi:hypothetical protein